MEPLILCIVKVALQSQRSQRCELPTLRRLGICQENFAAAFFWSSQLTGLTVRIPTPPIPPPPPSTELSCHVVRQNCRLVSLFLKATESAPQELDLSSSQMLVSPSSRCGLQMKARTAISVNALISGQQWQP